jgi:hypothetical protein
MILGLDHIGVVVKDLKKAIRVLEKLSLAAGERETIEHLKVAVAFSGRWESNRTNFSHDRSITNSQSI